MRASYNQITDTIAAIATAPMEGAIAIIRISGKLALPIAKACFFPQPPSWQSHKAYYGKILDQEGKTLDSVLLLPFLAPRSYTGEDIVEIHCHGGMLITKQVMSRVFALGAVPAAPGEFTMRAFLHGKMDLAQAESVQEVICAKNQAALDAAKNQLEGSLSQKVSAFQNTLLLLAAEVEARVDFPEEDLLFDSYQNIDSTLQKLEEQINWLKNTYVLGKNLKTSLRVCLAGVPNAGKSSLLNLLLGKQRAIVTPIAGTTRDTIEEETLLDNLPVFLIDTAGIRNTADQVEQEGIKRSAKAIEQADITLLVLDPEKFGCPEQQKLIQDAHQDKTIFVWNKVDLYSHLTPNTPQENTILLSAKTEFGLKELIAHIKKRGAKTASKEEIILTSQRHATALEETLAHISQARQNLLSNTSAEFIAIDIKDALYSLSKILGMDVEQEILTSIFSQFCLGK